MNRPRRRLFLLVLAPAIAGALVTGWSRVQAWRERGPYQPVDLRALRAFNFNPITGTENNIPTWIRKLDGQRVSLDGMMWNLTSAGHGVAQFQLVYNLNPSPFVPPQVQDRVFVQVPQRASIVWYDQVVRVRGTLHVRLARNDLGEVVRMYTLTNPIIDLPPPGIPPRATRMSDAWVWGLLASAIIGLALLASKLRHFSRANRRRRAGLCARCGYDLRATPLACPECGSPVVVRPWDDLG